VKLNNPHSTAFGLVLCAIASQLRRDPLATQEYADELIELTNRHELHWKPIAMVLKGWAMAKQTPGVENLEMIENGLAVWQQAGVRVFIPYCLGLLAETHRELGQIPQARTAVTEALSILAQTREGWCESELHRLQGELILQAGADQQDAEQSFVQSLEIARNCQALVLELYSAVSLSQLWIEQGRSLEVPELLQPIIARFNEDSDHGNLKRACELVAISS
jgi:predicted ATPase